MRIEGNRANEIITSDAPKSRTAQAKARDSSSEAEHVNISSAARELSAADNAKQDKIDALRRSIESGTYRVEPEKVADAMIRHMQRIKAGGE